MDKCNFSQAVILLKLIFQFEFIPWNSATEENLHANNPFWPPRIIGVEQKDKWSTMDLAQLIAFFFHKQMLSVSLPGFESPQRRSKCLAMLLA